MPEFSSLNGYTVKDTTARNIAKGRNQAVAFSDYATMIETLNAMEKSEYKTGQNIYIGVVGVPDLWVYSVEDVVHNFSYVSDDDVVEKLTTNTTIQAGYYKLAMLEGQKVDLTTYDEKLAEHTEDIAELNKNIQNVNIYVGDDEKLHFVDSAGADSVLPFNSGLKFLELGIFEVGLAAGQEKTITVNFKNTYNERPKLIFLGNYISKTDGNFESWGGLNPYVPYLVLHEMSNPTTTGFTIKSKCTASSGAYSNKTIYGCVSFEDWEKLAVDVT